MHAFIQRFPEANVKIMMIHSCRLAAGVGGLRARELSGA